MIPKTQSHKKRTPHHIKIDDNHIFYLFIPDDVHLTWTPTQKKPAAPSTKETAGISLSVYLVLQLCYRTDKVAE